MRSHLSKAAVAVVSLLGCSRDARPPEGEPRAATAPPASMSAAPAAPAPAPAQAAAAPAAETGEDQPMERVPDIEYVPTPQNVVDKMLEAGKVGKTDVLYDLGCGDGRIVVTAAKKFGIKAFGFDLDPQRIKESKENAKKAGVENLVTFEQKDIFKVDLSPATVVTLYLLPELNVKLIPQLEKLKPGARIVSHDFDMEGVTYEKWWTVIAPDHRDAKKNREHYVYLWKTPLKKTAK
jgi:SAM-dependent methyltransferase